VIPAEQPDFPWYAPKVQRTKWYDLFSPEDRTEAMRCIWGVMSYAMRTGRQQRPMLGERQRSEISHAFHFRKKKYENVVDGDDDDEPARSSSVAF